MIDMSIKQIWIIGILTRLEFVYACVFQSALLTGKNIWLNHFICQEPLWSRAPLVGSLIPFPPPTDDYSDGSWCGWLNTSSQEKSPHLKRLVEMF